MKSWALAAPRRTRKSRAPTGVSQSNIIPTKTLTTLRPKKNSKRRPRHTAFYQTTNSANVTIVLDTLVFPAARAPARGAHPDLAGSKTSSATCYDLEITLEEAANGMTAQLRIPRLEQ